MAVSNFAHKFLPHRLPVGHRNQQHCVRCENSLLLCCVVRKSREEEERGRQGRGKTGEGKGRERRRKGRGGNGKDEREGREGAPFPPVHQDPPPSVNPALLKQ